MGRASAWTVTAMLLLGCGPNVPTDEDSGAQDSSGDPTHATATTAGTATTAPTSADTGVDTTSTTTGTPAGCAGDWVTGCQSYCAAAITCDPESGVYEECVMDCVNELAGLGSECQLAWCEAFSCLGALDCATLEIGTPECNELSSSADALCYPGDSSGSDGDGGCYVGGGPDGQCEYGCTASDRRFTCDSTTCTCFEGGVQTASCPGKGICDDLGSISDYAMACCGW